MVLGESLFCCFISKFSIVVSNFFWDFIESFFVMQYRVNFYECSMCLEIMCILCLLGTALNIYLLRSNLLTVLLKSSLNFLEKKSCLIFWDLSSE